MIKTIIFDWDGTLHDTNALYANAVRKAYAYLVESGYAQKRTITEEETSKYLGMAARDMWQDFMPGLPEDVRLTAEIMIGDEMVSAVENGCAKLYAGVVDTLTRLRELGYNMLVLSNCKEDYMEAHRRCFELDRFFDEYAPAGNYDFIPKEEIFDLLRTRYEGDYLMVGDRDSDLRVGTRKNVFTVGCRYGFGKEEELEAADYQIDQISELIDVLSCINKKIMNSGEPKNE